jgi:hypothetical protein
VQTQLLALLQKQQAQPAATEGKQRRPRRNSVSPVSQSSFKKTTTSVAAPAFPASAEQPAARRRGSWSSSLAAAQSAAVLGLTDEAAAVSAMQLLALAHDVRHSKRDAKRANCSSSPFGKAKEAEPYGSFDEDAGDLQPHPDFLASSSSMAFAPTSSAPSTPSRHAPMQERKNVMSISALLN